jgi:hypothetical protein
VEGGYDLREFLRQIARSNAYQRSSVPPAPESWAGPDGGDAVIAARQTATQEQLTRLIPQMDQLTADMQAAALRVQHSMQDVETLRKQVDEALPAIEEQLSDQQEVTDDSKIRVDDQRSRIHALTNRCLALGEFVVEARGVQRRSCENF